MPPKFSMAQNKTNALPAAEARISQMIHDALYKVATDELDDSYPGWREITGSETADRRSTDMGAPFRKWLSSQEASYQERVNQTSSANVILRAIELFARYQSRVGNDINETGGPD